MTSKPPSEREPRWIRDLERNREAIFEGIRRSLIKPTEDTTRAISKSIAKPSEDAMRAISKSIEQTVLRNREGLDRAARVVRQIIEHFDLAELAREAIAEALAPNWRDLDREQMEAAEKLAMDKGVCVVWVPRHSTLVELLAVRNDDELTDVLLANADQILDDIAECLNEVTDPALAPADGLANRRYTVPAPVFLRARKPWRRRY